MKGLLTACLTLLAAYCRADGATITGNFTVKAGATETYTVSWNEWDIFYENNANVTWTVVGGTVVSQSKHEATIHWDIPQGYSDTVGSIHVYEDLGAQGREQPVTIENHRVSESVPCSGILGPTVIYEDFGSGPNPGAALPTGTTTYRYLANCGLLPGEYTILSSTVNCRSSWHDVPADHTGNPNGYMMMINADDNRNIIYAKQIPLPNSAYRYEFSAWVGNLYNETGAQNPIIRFEIFDGNDNPLGNSGSIEVPTTIPFQWQRIAFTFELANINSTNIKVYVVNTRPNTGNIGNDMVVDDISFAPCYPPILASFSATALVSKEYICNTGTVNLYARWPSTIPFANPAYQWQRSTDNGATWANIAGATSLNHTLTEPVAGMYQYRMRSYASANPTQFVVSNNITYFVQKLVVEAKTEELFSCSGSIPSGQVAALYKLLYADPDKLPNLSYSFAWSPTTYINNPVGNPAYIVLPAPPVALPNGPPQPSISYTFTVQVTNIDYGCTASNIQTVVVKRPRKVFVPSSFSPNGDGLNDLFRPVNLQDYPGAIFEIYNRWGKLVFHSEGPTVAAYSWDGTYRGVLQEMASYVWRVTMAGCPYNIYGATNGEGVTYGNVVLIR